MASFEAKPTMESSSTGDADANSISAPLPGVDVAANPGGNDTKPSATESETKETDVTSVVDKFGSLSTKDIEKIRHIQATHAHLTSDITFDDPSLRM